MPGTPVTVVMFGADERLIAQELWSPEARVGWVHGGCLGIHNTILQPGTPVTIAIFGADERTDGDGTPKPKLQPESEERACRSRAAGIGSVG